MQKPRTRKNCGGCWIQAAAQSTAPSTKTCWRRVGRGIRKDAEPYSYTVAYGRSVSLYNFDQTTQHTPYTVARNYLVDLFVGYPDRFGFTTSITEEILTYSKYYSGPINALVARGFNYEACSRGIPVGKKLAQSFHVASQSFNNWFVIDLDNHSPTLESTRAHLLLLSRLVSSLNQLNTMVGIKSSFYQYRQIDPTGIQLWVVLKYKRHRNQLYKTVRKFLTSLGSDVDQILVDNSLASLNNIEIQPTSHLISMIGSYGKEVFTNQPLRIIKKRFDCIGLCDHIKNNCQAGDVFKRYSELVYAQGLVSDNYKSPQILSGHQPDLGPLLTDHQCLSWTDIKNIALWGVTKPDILHDGYFQPLAQALLLREFYSSADREEKTFQVLKEWIIKKHNNLVSRILNGKIKSVESQIRSTIKGILQHTPAGISNHYASMVLKDQQFPYRIQPLVPLLQASPDPYPSLLIDCKVGISPTKNQSQTLVSQRLPSQKVLTRKILRTINQYLITKVRKGKTKKRISRFMRLLISAIGAEGKKYINEDRLHVLAGKKEGSDNSYLQDWKQHLVQAKILMPGWYQGIVRNERSSRYQLTEWVIMELRADHQFPAGPGKCVEGRLNKKRHTRPINDRATLPG